MAGRKKITALYCLFFAGLLGLCSCGSSSSDLAKNPVKHVGGQDVPGQMEDENAVKNELVYEGRMELKYAENFSVDYYKGGYKMLSIIDGTKILVIPEGKEIPDNLDEKVIVMQQPITNLYLVASSVMDMFDQLDALDTIRFSGQREDGWYIESAKEAMARKDIVYAGKYNKPDYELLVSENCSLAIENRMISHSPEVAEMMAENA